jgi:hypothetical protein
MCKQWEATVEPLEHQYSVAWCHEQKECGGPKINK